MAEILKIREITIDTMQHKEFNVKEEELKLIRFYQNDLNTAKLLINVTHDKVVTDFSSATSVQISFLKPDRKRVFQDVQNVNQMQGKYYVVLSTQTLIAYGDVIAQLRFTFPNNKVIETCKFAFTVDESIMSDDAMKSTDEFPIIQKAIEVGEKFVGVDFGPIIAAGELAKGAVKRSGDIMTGNLDFDTTTSTRAIRATNGGIRQQGYYFDPNGDVGLYNWVDSKSIYKYYRATNTFDIQCETNLVKKADVFTDISKANGDAALIVPSGQDMLATIISAGRGIRTVYAPGSAVNSPSSNAFRGIVNLQGTAYGYIIGVTSDNKVWSNFINGSTWSGWKCVTGNEKDGKANIPLTADGENFDSASPLTATRRGNTVTIRGAIRAKSGTSGSVNVANIPVDMRPTDSQIMLFVDQGNQAQRVFIGASGNINLYNAERNIYLQTTYVVD